MGVKYKFPCGRWISKDHDDGQLERELYVGTDDVEAYEAKVPYELTSKCPGNQENLPSLWTLTAKYKDSEG